MIFAVALNRKVVNDVKAMVYRKESGNREILHRGEYKGHQFYIVSYQTHPCCYVKTDMPDSEAYEKSCVLEVSRS